MLVVVAGLAWAVLLLRPAGGAVGPAAPSDWGALAPPAAPAAPDAPAAQGGVPASEDLREVWAGEEQAAALRLADRARAGLDERGQRPYPAIAERPASADLRDVWGASPTAAPPEPWTGRSSSAVVAAVGPPVHAAASFLAAWALVVLAVGLPAAVPTLAAYGAARRAGFGPRGAALHAGLFVLPAAGAWLLAGVPVYLASVAVGAAATASPAVAARTPYLVALGLAGVAFYRLSPAHETCQRAARRPAGFWVRRALPGIRGTLAVGWAHAVGSVGAGAGLVAVLVLGTAALPWAVAVAVLLVVERLLPRPERSGLAANCVLLALAVLRWASP
jgi:predicted metal-binding membrane protein